MVTPPEYPDAESVITTDKPPDPVPDLGEGEPPPEMVESFGMEPVPAEGPSDEHAEGREVVDLEQAVAESEAAAQANPEGTP